MCFSGMQETIQFKKLRGSPARNVGVTGKAGFWQAMSYEVSITNPKDGQNIHHEMGHFLLRVVDEKGEAFELNHDEGRVIRQATIPRANAMMTLGVLTLGNLSKAAKDEATVFNKGDRTFYSARPLSKENQTLQSTIDTELQRVSGGRRRCLEQPLNWMNQIQLGTPLDEDWVFSFREEEQSHMASGHRVESPVQVGRLFSDFWIGKRERDGKTIDILQYAQKVNVGFNNMQWPHVAVNTLIKK